MLFQYVKKGKKGDRGITLTEMLLAVIVAGILAAVTAPSLIGLLNQNRVKDAFFQLRGAIKEAQRQAMRRGRSCKILIDTIDRKVKVSSPDAQGDYTGCLLREKQLPEGISIKTNKSNPNVIFSAKGNTSSAQTIVVYGLDTQIKKCLVISLGLGIMRSGNYTGDVDSTVTSKYCHTIGS